MAISYIGSGVGLSASRMNALVTDLDDALSVLYSGKSPLAFGSFNEALSGIQFLFGDPDKRKILLNDSRQYDSQTLRTIASSLVLVGSPNDETLEWSFKDPTQAQYDQVAEMFGYSAGFQNDCLNSNAWLFDWSLEPMRANFAFPSADFGWMKCYRAGVNAGVIQPSERLHDRAVAEIIIEGWPDALFTWPKYWGKFGCLRFHNLDKRELTVAFHEGTKLKIPPFGCRAVRLYGASEGVRPGVSVDGKYLWYFQSGDAPIWNATRNRNAGVWGCQGYSSLASIQLLHDWIDSVGPRFHIDPTIKWDGASEYAGTFGTLSDSDCLAKYTLHAGNYKSLKLQPDGTWNPSIQSIRWNGNTLQGGDVVIETAGSTATIKTTHDATHDVIPVSTNLLPTGATTIPEAGISFEAQTPSFGFTRLDGAITSIGSYYYDGNGSVVEVESSVNTATEVERIAPAASGFTFTLGQAKALALSGETGPSSSVSTFAARTLTFDGLSLSMALEYTAPLTHLIDATQLPDNLAEWDLSNKWTFKDSATIAIASRGYSLFPGRVNRFFDTAPAYQASRNVWGYSQHPNARKGDPANGEDWKWVAPDSNKPGVFYHAQAGSQFETRSWPVVPIQSNWLRAISGSSSGAWWVINRDAILGGEITADDRRLIWRIPGAREHYNHLAARLNSIRSVAPYQITDLVYWGAPLGSTNAVGNGGAAKPPRFGCRLDNDSEAYALAVEARMNIKTENDVPAFARLAAQDASAQLGDGYTWLYTAGPLVGFPASNETPEYRWVTIDEIAALAERLGVFYRVERVGTPKRLAVYQGQGVSAGQDWTWYSLDTFAAYWETAYACDFIEAISSKTASAICEWTIPISSYEDEPDDNWDYIQSNFVQGAGIVGGLNLPFSGLMRQSVVIETAEHAPTLPSGWSATSKTRLLIQPEPHLRYDRTTDDRNGLAYVEIASVAAPPVNPCAPLLSSVMGSVKSKQLMHSDFKAIVEAELNASSDFWGHRTMNYVTLIPRSAVFRA